MDLYQVISYPLYAGAVLEIILGIALLKQAPRASRAKRACAGLFFSAAAFLLFTAISYTLESQGRDYNVFNRASWIGWFMIPACLQFAYYMQDENSRVARIVGYVLYPFWSVVFALTLFTDLVEPGDPSLIPFVALDGPLEKPFRIVGGILALWLLFVLYRTKNRMTGLKKSQFSLFFFGTLFFNIGCILIASILPLFGAINPDFTAFVSLPWVVITYYAITRHRFFDLRLFVSRVLSMGLLLAVLSVMQIALFRVLFPVLGGSFSIAASLSALGILFFATRLNRRMQDWVQQLVLQDKYDYQKILQESIKAVTSILDLGELLGYIVGSVKKSLKVENSYLLLKEKDGQFSIKRGFNVQQERVPGSPVLETLLTWLQEARHGVVREELEHMTAYGADRMSEAMQTMGAELIIPLLYKGDMKGFMVLGRKGNSDPYFQSDINLLETLAGHAAIAIENAQLYEEVRLAKESMRESEEKFRTLAETAPATIFIHQGGNFLYANPASEHMIGYAREEFLKMDFWGVAHPDDKDMIVQRARAHLSGDEAPQRYEFRIVAKNRDVVWVDMAVGMIEYEGRQAVLGICFDITARKQAEQERERFSLRLQQALQSLKESEARFRTLAETTAAMIIIHRGGRFLYTNPAVQRIMGYTAEELANMEYFEVIHPDFRELVRERGRARLAGAEPPAEYEFKLATKNGGVRWASITAAIIEFEGKPAVIATLFDVTDRKQAEEEQVRLYEQRIAEEKRHVVEKEKLLMDLHDGIGGITTNISILTDLARKATDIEGVKSTLSTISRLSREGIAEIRSFMHSLDAEDLNWRTIATELRNQGTNMVEPHGIAFALKATVDEDIQEQPTSLLWVNLFKIYKESLTNAIKHSKADAIAVEFGISGEELLLDVSDNGIGREEDWGKGRGLSNMNKRASELGGRVTMSFGKGTRMSLAIPLPLKYPA